MEALSGSAALQASAPPSYSSSSSSSSSSPRASSLVKLLSSEFRCSKNRAKIASLKLSRFPPSALRCRTVLRVAGGGGGGGNKDDSVAPPNAFSISLDDGPTLLENDETRNDFHQNDKSVTVETRKPIAIGSGISASRPGLFRTPISGGVQNATFAHNLPKPALAVRNLMEQARFAHLCTIMSKKHNHREGYPVATLVDFAPDMLGHPIFSLSSLAIHTRNLLSDKRCSLVVQIPGWSSLSNARVTFFGDIVPLHSDEQEWARQQFLSKHQKWATHQWGNFYYYRMHNISDVYFIGGFGTVAWIDVKEYEATQPDKISTESGEETLKELNAMFSKPLKEILSTEDQIDDAAVISLDSKGADIRVRHGAQFNIQRLPFEVETGVQTLEEVKEALHKIISSCCRSNKLPNRR